MFYEPGDHVYPYDLPRWFLCRVERVEAFRVGAGLAQILELRPLEGPWPGGTRLIRLDGAVTQAPTRELWRRRGLVQSPGVERPRLRTRVVGGPPPEREAHETTRAVRSGRHVPLTRHDEVTMDYFLESRVRRLVADNLGVSVKDLTPDVSLTDDLAADSLDLVELVLALEEEFGLTVPERAIAEVRTYGELLAAIVTLARSGAEARPAMEPIRMWVRVVAPAGVGGVLERA